MKRDYQNYLLVWNLTGQPDSASLKPLLYSLNKTLPLISHYSGINLFPLFSLEENQGIERLWLTSQAWLSVSWKSGVMLSFGRRRMVYICSTTKNKYSCPETSALAFLPKSDWSKVLSCCLISRETWVGRDFLF